jgi:hypothetical protein
MRPVNFNQANRIYKGSPGMMDVPAQVDDAIGLVSTLWMPSFEERAAIMAGQPVVLHSLSGGTMFPTRIDVLTVQYDDLDLEEDKEDT